MMTFNHLTSKSNSGFALLLTILVLSVVLGISLTMLSLSIKQVQLSVDTRDSEIAFHAASAGLECMRYWRRNSATASNFESASGSGVSVDCFDVGSTAPGDYLNLFTDTLPDDVTLSGGGGSAARYNYRLSWGSGNQARCSEMSMIVMNVDLTADSEMELEGVSRLIPGYTGLTDVKTCDPGGFCTIVSSRGYSRACPSSGTNFPIGTVQRDILVEF